MFSLTRQEQFIVAFVMLALVAGTLARVYRAARQPSGTTVIQSQTNHPSFTESHSHGENIH